MAISGYYNHDLIGSRQTDLFRISDSKETAEEFSDIAVELYNNRLLQQLWNKVFLAEEIRNNHTK